MLRHKLSNKNRGILVTFTLDHENPGCSLKTTYWVGWLESEVEVGLFTTVTGGWVGGWLSGAD